MRYYACCARIKDVYLTLDVVKNVRRFARDELEKNVKLVIQMYNNARRARGFVRKNTQQFSVREKNNGE